MKKLLSRMVEGISPISSIFSFFFHAVSIYTGLPEYLGGTRCSSWLRHCSTSLKVAGSIPDTVIGILH